MVITTDIAKEAPADAVRVESVEVFWAWLRQGWIYRVRQHPEILKRKKEYADRVKYEAQMMADKDFIDYFLMLSDVVRFAKDNGVPVGPARGSAAASLVCYLLRITEVDPMLFPNMVFERFIDVTRMDLPDVDLDFDDELRDRIRQHLITKYGEARVGNIGNFIRYRGKNAIADVARVREIPFASAEIVKNLVIERSGGDSRFDASLQDTAEMFPQAAAVFEEYPALWDAVKLEGNLKGMSVHAAGLVVANTDITDFCALYSRQIGKDKRTVSVLSVDKYDGEHLNLLKIDVLGLTTMGLIRIALELIDISLDDLYAIPLDEPKTLAAFKRNEVVGIFQFEGRATRLVNKDVSPDNFNELADINALSRPGPLFSGATAEYVDTKHGRRERMSFHPAVDQFTKFTHGQIVYQEQILQIVREVGDFPWTHAAAIRKIISQKKGEAAFNEMQGMFVEGAARLHKIDEELALRIWRQLVTSGTYAFCATGDTVVYRNGVNKQHGGDGITLEHLYDRLHPDILPADTAYDGPCVACGKTATQPRKANGRMYRRGVCASCISWQDAFKRRGLRLLSMDDDGRIRPNGLVDVHSPVLREVTEFTTSAGRTIRVSAAHRFMTPGGYRLAEDMRVGDEIMVMGDLEPTPIAERQSHSSTHVGKLEAAKRKVLTRSGNKCEHCGKPNDGSKHCLEFAHILTLTDLDGDWDKFHHPSNLMHLCNSCHKTFDYRMNGTRKARFSRGRLTETDTIVSIEPAGSDWVYEVSMAGPSHNYIGNGFVNHNNIAHCISYSILGFWAMWLKVHHPLEFFTASLRKADPTTPSYVKLLKEAGRCGVEILPPDLETSGVTWMPDREANAVRSGFMQIRGIGEKTAETIIENRERLGPFNGWEDLIRVKGIGVKTAAVIKEFADQGDPFGLQRTHKLMVNVRKQIRAGQLGPVPHPSHTSDEIPPDADRLRVNFLGVVRAKNYQDYIENQRARTGEEVSEIMARLDQPDKVTSCVLHAFDDGDEDVYLRFDRFRFPKFKEKLESLQVGTDMVIASGMKRSGFGIAVHVDYLEIITPEPADFL